MGGGRSCCRGQREGPRELFCPSEQRAVSGAEVPEPVRLGLGGRPPVLKSAVGAAFFPWALIKVTRAIWTAGQTPSARSASLGVRSGRSVGLGVRPGRSTRSAGLGVRTGRSGRSAGFGVRTGRVGRFRPLAMLKTVRPAQAVRLRKARSAAEGPLGRFGRSTRRTARPVQANRSSLRLRVASE